MNRAGPETLTTPSTAGFTLAPATSEAIPPIDAPTRKTFCFPRLRMSFTAPSRSLASRFPAVPARACERPWPRKSIAKAV